MINLPTLTLCQVAISLNIVQTYLATYLFASHISSLCVPNHMKLPPLCLLVHFDPNVIKGQIQGHIE